MIGAASSVTSGAEGVVLRHVIRWGLGAVALGAIGVAFARHRARTGTSSDDVRSRWRQIQMQIWARGLIAGAIVGATWSYNSRQPLWLHAVRVLVVVAVVGPLVRLVLRRVRQRTPRPHRTWTAMLAVRLGSVAGGALEQWLLQHAMAPGPAAVTTGITMAVAIGIGGPLYVTYRVEREYRARRELRDAATTPAA